MKHIPSQLSGGQQQRAAIARAICGEPRVILADEPTGNLDTTMSTQIMDLLQEINTAGTTILMVTHIRSSRNAFIGNCISSMAHRSGSSVQAPAAGEGRHLRNDLKERPCSCTTCDWHSGVCDATPF